MSPPAPVEKPFQPLCLTYATYDKPRYSPLLVVVSGKPHITPFLCYFSCFGDVEVVWGARSDLGTRFRGPVFVKFARSSQALRALEYFRATGNLAWPHFSRMSVAQSRVPGKPKEVDLDLQKLTVIRVTIPRFYTEGRTAETFKAYGVIVSCFILRIELVVLRDVGFSTPSEAALAIEECDERFHAIWAEAMPELPNRPDLRLGVRGAQQGTTKHVAQSATLNTMCQSTGLAKSVTEPSQVSESSSPVNDPNQKTTCQEVQESSLHALGGSTSLAKVVIEPSQVSESEFDVNPSKPKTSGDVQKSSVNTLGKDTQRNKLAMKPGAPPESNFPVNDLKHKTTSADVQGSKLETFSKSTSLADTVTKPGLLSESGAEESNLVALGYCTSEVQQVFKPPEHSGYKYYVSGTDSLSEPSVQPPGSNLDYYYYTSGVEQQTDDHSIKESNMVTSSYSTHLPLSVNKPLEPNVCPVDESTAGAEAKGAEVQQDAVLTAEKSLKSSEWKFYMGGARRGKRSQENSLLTSVDPPDLASVERSNPRKESISRHLLMVSEFPLTQEQIFGLFDVIPGLESCKARPGLHRKHVYAMIQYRNVASAVYAKHRLHGLDYPLGNQLRVSFMEDKIHGTELLQEMATQLVTSHLASVIWDNNWAPQLLRSTESWMPPPRLQTDAVLPSYKNKAPPHSSILERLLIIFDPCPIPQNVLDNVLSRFGNFIASHFIPRENGAYAMFAERKSASDAIAMLHGKTVNDVKLKVTLSDLPTEDFSKRQRLF